MLLSSIYRLCIYVWCVLFINSSRNTCVFVFYWSIMKLSNMKECLLLSWAQFAPHVFSRGRSPSTFFFFFFPAFLSNLEEQHQRTCLYQAGAPELPSSGICHGCSTRDQLCCFVALTAASTLCSRLGILSRELSLITWCRDSFKSCFVFCFCFWFFFPLRYFPSHCWEHFQFPLNQKKIDVLITSDHGICHPCLKEVSSIRESQEVSFNFLKFDWVLSFMFFSWIFFTHPHCLIYYKWEEEIKCSLLRVPVFSWT